MRLKTFIQLLGLLAAGMVAALAAPPATNSPAPDFNLMVDSSSMPVAGGTAKLIIGRMEWSDGVYHGKYRIKVFPYFMKNEEGTLAITASAESIRQINAGKLVIITGTATKNGKEAKARAVTISATPADVNHGKLKLWFMVEDRKMTFEPDYRFIASQTSNSAFYGLSGGSPNANREPSPNL